MAMRIRLKKYDTYSVDATGHVTTARLVYHCDELGTQSTADILRAVKSAAASTIENSGLSTVELVDLPHGDCCDVAVNYTERAKRSANDVLWSFDVSGGTATVRTDFGKMDAQGATVLTDNASNYTGWNGKFGEGFSCSGTSVIVPTMRETCRRTLAASSITADFRRGIGELVGKVNSAAFHGWDAGEVLFAGASLSAPYTNDQGATLVDVNYSFLIRPNEASQTIGGFTLTDVLGWDYAWGITGYDGPNAKQDVLAVFVSRVYGFADLTALGIGS